jgi:hypothetical protein
MTASASRHPEQKEAMSFINRDLDSESSGVSMDLMSLVRLVFRHWRVTVPAGVLTFALVMAAFLTSSPSYAANASVALISPPQAPDTADGTAPTDIGQNPFNRYGDLSVVADIVARKMDSDAEHLRLKAKGVSGYTVVANRLSRGPLVDVTGTGTTPEAAMSSAKLVIAEFDTVLTDLQKAEGADPNYLITSAAIEPPETATAQVGSTVRTAIAAMAVGALGTLGLAVLAEAWTRRRAVSRRAAEAADAAPPLPPPAGDRQAAAPAGARRPDAAPVRPTDDRRSTWPLPAAPRRPEGPPVREQADSNAPSTVATRHADPADRGPSASPDGRGAPTRPSASPDGRGAPTRPSANGGTAGGPAGPSPKGRKAGGQTGASAKRGKDGGQSRASANGEASPTAADRPPAPSEEWARWLPASGNGHENGRKQTTADGSS